MNIEGNIMWKMSWFLAVCLSVFLVSGTVLAQDNQIGKIDGFVFHDADKNGAYQPENGDGLPSDALLSDVQIVVQADSTGQVFTTETDIRGGYEVTGLPLDDLYTVQVNISTVSTDKFPAATAGRDSIGAIAWVVFLSSDPPDPTTVLLPSNATVSFGFGPAAPTTVVVSEINVAAVSWHSLVVLFTVLGIATRFVVCD